MSVAHNRQSGIIVVLEDIHDPHNAAAILRTCDGLGIQTVYFVFEKETPYNPRRIGKASSSSANKWLDFEIFDSSLSCFETLKQKGYTTVATALSDKAESLRTAQFPEEKIALLVGNEKTGLSKLSLIRADRIISIPMAGFVQSFNVSVATAIILWEITRQRGDAFHLPQKERQELLETFIIRSGK